MMIEEILLDILSDNEEGFTWKELQLILRGKNINAHHGTISGALSTLHSEKHVFYLKTLRNNCHPYVHAIYRDSYTPSMRKDAPRKNKWWYIAKELFTVLSNEEATSEEKQKAINLYLGNLP